MSTNIHQIEPKIGEGIYLVKDVAKILQFDYDKTLRWIVDYWGGTLDEHTRYVFGDVSNRAINFYSLIEFYTFFKLREKGLSTIEIKRLHRELSDLYHTEYPFATASDFYLEKRRRRSNFHAPNDAGKVKKTFVYYRYLESLIRNDNKHQFSLEFVKTFLEKVEFDDNNLAARFWPLANSKNVVVDPKRQFGQPIISGTNIRTQTLFSLYEGGEKLEDISGLYNISIDKVQDAIAFQNAA